MQAIIMAAGRGSRMQELTDSQPKPLLEIGGESIIGRQVALFNKYGIKDITVVVGYKKELIQTELNQWPINFVFNPFYALTNVLGSFWFALDKLGDDFIFVHGDTIFEEDILKRLIQTNGDLVLASEKKQCGEEEMKIRTVDGEIVEINKTMAPSAAAGEFIGLAKVSQLLIPKIKLYTQEFIGQGNLGFFFETVIQKIIDQKDAPVKIADVTGLKWNEIDFQADLEKAKRLFS